MLLDRRGVIVTILLLVLLGGCSSESPDQLIAEADEALADGDVRTALIQLRNALDQAPDNTEALLRMGNLYLVAGQAATAERYYRSAALAGANPERFQRAWLQALLGTGRFKEALERSGALPRTDPTRFAVRGFAQQGLKQFTAAEQEFRTALELAPDSADAHANLAQLLLRVDRKDEADQQIATALELDAQNASALTLSGTRLFAAGDTAAAVQALQAAVTAAEQNSAIAIWQSALSALAEVRLYQKELAAAERIINRMAGTLGEQITVRYLRAQLAVQKGDLRAARDILHGILGDDETHAPSQRLLGSIYALENRLNLAELYLKMAVNSDARDPIATGMLAVVRLRQNQPEAALDLLGNPEDLSESAEAAGFLALAGQASLQAGNVDRALAYFGAGAQAYPGDWRFALGQALAYLRARRTDEAILLLESLDEKENPQVRGTALVLSYLQKGDREKAGAEAEALAKRFQDQVWSHNLLAAWRMQSGDFDGASRAYAYAYQLQPNPDSAAGSAEARMRGGLAEPGEWLKDWLARNPGDLPTLHALGQLTLATKQYDAARTYYEQVIEQDPQHAGALNNLAWIYQVQGDQRAIEIARQARKVARNNPAVLDTLGWALLRFDQVSEARSVLQEAAELAPDDFEIRYHHAVAIVRDGDAQSGRQLLAELVASGAEFPSRDEAQKMLARL